MASQNEPVIIYGMDHSPWVQTVLMTCHFYSVPYRLMSRQLSFANYRRAGMIMPEVRFPDGRIVGDSFEIMREVTGRYGLASADSLVQTEDISRLSSVSSFPTRSVEDSPVDGWPLSVAGRKRQAPMARSPHRLTVR